MSTLSNFYNAGAQRTFTDGALSEIAFPIGGIGTGTISLGGRGQLRDFEIYNHPDKGNTNPFTFFALWARPEGGEPVARVLEGKIPPPYREPGGEPANRLAGLPRFTEVSFRGEYPFATVQLDDPDVPVRTELTAWNPFLPLNVKDSALPVAIFEWTLTNDGDTPVEVALAASLLNPLTAPDDNGKARENGSLNAVRDSELLRGVYFSHPKAPADRPETGTLALTTPWAELDVIPHWYRGGWFDRAHLFWDAFAATGRVPDFGPEEPTPQGGDVSSLLLRAVIPAGGSVTLPVYLTWHFPVRLNPWKMHESLPDTLETFVGAHFKDAWDVAEYFEANAGRLRQGTSLWREAIFGSTLPATVLEAVTSQASILRTNTCFLLADGSFFGWEGQWHKGGSCHGSCTHVWNYEQAVAFLFPELERSMRRTEFLHNTRPSGNMAFRTLLPPGEKLSDFKPCADGQMGTIIQVFRDWQLSGDDVFLRQLWPNVKRALEYAWAMTPEAMEATTARPINSPTDEGYKIDSLWDPDKDGLMEGEQHNTYDIEFFGPNTMCTALYLGALRAAEEIARYLGEPEKAAEYRAVFESGRSKVDELLWNGEYYIQKVKVIPEVTVHPVLRSPRREGEAADAPAVPKYQYGTGCLSDQLLGQWAAHVAGLGYLLDEERVRTAVRSIFTHNFRRAIGSEANVQRVYALNDEPGLLLCSWPHGDRPALPFVYSDEVWTGIEYHVAAHLIYEGWIEEGLTIVQAVAERYSGYNRNPWNQIECGFHYARAMASWSVKLALDGFRYSVPEGMLGFAPKLNREDFRTFWSTGTAWGSYHQQPASGGFQLEVKSGALRLRRLELADLADGEVSMTMPAGTLKIRSRQGVVTLEEPVTLAAGESLSLASS